MKRNSNLDLLKIFACIAVVCLHMTAPIFDKLIGYTITHIIYYCSTFAIPIFFMVNGALLFNKESISIMYVLRKIYKIINVVFIFNLINYIVHLLLNRYIENPILLSINSMIQRGFFFQFWFFTALIIVYLVLPILHKLFHKSSYLGIVITVTIVIITLVIDIYNMNNGVNGRNLIIHKISQPYRLWTWFSYFCMGGLIYKNKIFIRSKITIRNNILIFIVFSVMSLIYQYRMSIKINSIYAENFYDNIIVMLWVMSLFMLIERIRLKDSLNRAISFTSENIMGVFIVHIFVMNSIDALQYSTVISNLIMITVVLLISFIISRIINDIPYFNKVMKL